MRIWTVHPKYLDPQGLVALWREALLARAVLRGETAGYRHHPQLVRFMAQAAPRSAINVYLAALLDESRARGYHFDASKAGRVRTKARIETSAGQLQYEWRHLLAKLKLRSPALFRRWRGVLVPQAHPLFRIVPGPVESWERPPAAPRSNTSLKRTLMGGRRAR
jgi:hypothetical protein